MSKAGKVGAVRLRGFVLFNNVRSVLRRPVLYVQNVFGRRSVLGAAGADVALTSYGARLRSVHITIESIARGRVRPRRLILWLADDLEGTLLPSGIRRLVARGLEVRYAPDTRSFKKFYPYVTEKPAFDSFLVTADDDVMYPRYWLKRLLARAVELGGDVVVCYRAHRFSVAGDVPAPYQTWDRSHSVEPSILNFATGVSGVLYPPAVLLAIKRAGDGFLKLCPYGDDIWLHYQTVKSGRRIAQVPPIPLDFPWLRGSQTSALWDENALRNDEQIRNTYGPDVLRVLSEAGGNRDLCPTAGAT